MAAILSAVFPDKAPHFVVYMRTIARVSRTFESTAWASYDVAYRRQAANRGSLDWGTIDTGLYNDAFTGRAKAIPRCSYSLANTHVAGECPDAPLPRQQAPTLPQDKPMRSLVRSPSLLPRAAAEVEICRLYNAPGGSRCRFLLCRYAHLCESCHTPHSASECPDKWRGQRTRSPMPHRLAEPKPARQGGDMWPPQ